MRSILVTIALGLAFVAPAHAGAPSGWKFHAGEKGKPAILLIHGLAASRTHWTSPAETWSIKRSHYKHWKAPKNQSGKGAAVEGTVRSIVVSPVDKHADEEGSFWSYLVKQGFTVATWNQVPCMDTDKLPSTKCLDSDVFATAYPTAKEALAYLATQTTEDIALLAHSRGGLVGRKLLQEKDDSLPAVKRVKWFVTLHTPHHGSSLAAKGNALQKAFKNPLDVVDMSWMPKPVREAAKKLLPDVGEKLAGAIDVLVLVAGLPGAKELDGNGAVIKGIEEKETKRAGVKYYTFGGTSPRVARVYARVYTEGGLSSWKTEPKQILDYPGSFDAPFDELKKGGDLLVTDASSHFSLEDKHFTNKLNHAEVLWNKGVQKQVAALLVPQPTIADGEIEGGADDTEDDPDDDANVAPPPAK